MKEQCPWESRVASTPPDRPLPTDLAQHVSACEACRASLSIARSLREWAAEDIADRTAGARFLWLVAQERRMAQRAARVQLTALCAALLIVATCAFAAWRLQLLGPASSSGGIAAVLAIAVLFAEWVASDNASLMHP